MFHEFHAIPRRCVHPALNLPLAYPTPHVPSMLGDYQNPSILQHASSSQLIDDSLRYLAPVGRLCRFLVASHGFDCETAWSCSCPGTIDQRLVLRRTHQNGTQQCTATDRRFPSQDNAEQINVISIYYLTAKSGYELLGVH